MKKFLESMNEAKIPDDEGEKVNIDIKPRVFNRLKNNVEGNSPIKDKLANGPGAKFFNYQTYGNDEELKAEYQKLESEAQSDAIKLCHWMLDNDIGFEVATSIIGMSFDTFILSNNPEREVIRKKWINKYPQYIKK